MHTKEYHLENICRCLGLPGFDSDPALAAADRAVRLLLLPSFDPEVCITISETAGNITVAIIAARSMIWHKLELGYVLTHQNQFGMDDHLARPLLDDLRTATENHKEGQFFVIDGMPTHGVFFEKGQKARSFESNLGMPDELSHCTGRMVTMLRDQANVVPCKNALARLGKYLGLDLPEIKPDTDGKATVSTLVLGPAEERAELMQALRHVTKNR